MSIWSKFLKWWNSGEFAKPTKDMTTEELKAEYRGYYGEWVMTGSVSPTKKFRMENIEYQLNVRCIYINKSGVDVYFLNY